MNGYQASVRRGRPWRILILALAVVLIAALAVPLALAAPAKQTASIFRIGYLGPADSPTAHGAQLAIDQINSVGGISVSGTSYQLELVPLEDYPSVPTLPEAVNQLLQENVSVLLGPDYNALITPDTIQALVNTGLPVLTGATGDALTEIDTANYIFRIRAPERIYSYAIADYLTTDLGLSQIAAVQTLPEYTEAIDDFASILANRNISLGNRIVLPNGEAILDQVPTLVGLNPQAIVMWGGASEAGALLAGLRQGGWTGAFALRNAAEAAQQGAFPRAIVQGILGMDAWTYGADTEASRIFLHDYTLAYGEVPDPLSVAAYDAIWYLRSVIRAQGVQPAAIRTGLIQGGALTLVHAVFHPADFGNGDLARTARVYVLGKYGGPEVVAAYDDTQRLGSTQPALEPTAAPTPLPTAPLPPTATLEGVWAQVNVNTLNVRSGPGQDYQQVAQVKLGERYKVIGALGDGSWLVIDYVAGVGWVNAQYVQVIGDLAMVPIVAPPVTPTPAATPTVTVAPFPDIVIDTVTLTPAQPVIGQPFIATITVRNQGGAAAARFAVAATWQPGDAYAANFVEGLAAGQSVQIQLSTTLMGSPGVYQTAVVADLNNDVQEIDENNNTYTVTYQVNQ